MVAIILGALVLLTLYFGIVFAKDYMKASKENNLGDSNFWAHGAVGFLTNFLDTLGIGSFAPTTAFFKNFKMTHDRVIPGTLNVSMTIPVVAEALIFITIIQVDPVTLIALIAASVVGAILGAGVVAKMDERKIQLGMGIALIAVVVTMLAGQLKLMPTGGDAIGLTGIKLIVGIVVNFILGALMTLGIGLYAPCMALVYALGMSPKVAFPIMMGSCAFLMPAAGAKFVKEGAYDRKASLAITIFGTVGVLIAAYIVKSIPLDILKWIVDAVIVYTAIMMFRSASKTKDAKISA